MVDLRSSQGLTEQEWVTLKFQANLTRAVRNEDASLVGGLPVFVSPGAGHARRSAL